MRQINEKENLSIHISHKVKTCLLRCVSISSAHPTTEFLLILEHKTSPVTSCWIVFVGLKQSVNHISFSSSSRLWPFQDISWICQLKNISTEWCCNCCASLWRWCPQDDKRCWLCIPSIHPSVHPSIHPSIHYPYPFSPVQGHSNLLEPIPALFGRKAEGFTSHGDFSWLPSPIRLEKCHWHGRLLKFLPLYLSFFKAMAFAWILLDKEVYFLLYIAYLYHFCNSTMICISHCSSVCCLLGGAPVWLVALQTQEHFATIVNILESWAELIIIKPFFFPSPIWTIPFRHIT